MRRGWTAVSSLTIAGLLALSARAETVEDLEKKLTEIIAKQKSLQYKITSALNNDGTKSEASTTLDVVRKGERWMMRMETRSKTGPESSTMVVFDGEVQWTLIEGPGFKQVTKQKFDPKTMANPFDIKKQFANMRENFELKMLPDEKVAGHDCWVLEKTPKGAATPGTSRGKMVDYYDKTNGTLVKGVSGGGDAKYQSTTTLEDVKIDANIDAERFKFKVPEGAQVMDMDAMREGAAGGGGPTKP